MSATLTTPKTTSGGEIIRELVNSTDGQGLNFDGAAGIYLDIASPQNLGTTFSFEFILQADSIKSSGYNYIVDFGSGGRFALASIDGVLTIFDTGARVFTGATFLDDLKVHHLVVTVSGTSAIAYDNGNQFGTATLGGASDIDSCADARIATRYTDTGSEFDGTFYRARFWNKTLSQAEVTEVYENATIPRAIVANCISDYDLAFANPTQSLTVQDRRGAEDGTASATGVSQVTPIIQVNTVELVTENETLMGKIKSVTSATTVGAVQIYDTSQDSDGGAWRKKCKGLSWFDEASSATRSARSEFPAMALIVADTAVGVTIYDLDDPAMPMFLVIPIGGILDWATGSATSYCLAALNGRIYIGINDGGADFNLVKDYVAIYYPSGYTVTSSRRISDRGDTPTYMSGGAGPDATIVNYAINDVAATVLEGAEIGALGLPIPTVAVATAGGVSVIHPSGDVYDIIASTGPTVAYKIAFTDGAKIAFHTSDTAASTDYAHVHVVGVPYADISVGYFYQLSGEDYNYSSTTGDDLAAIPGGLATDVTSIAPMSEKGLAIGSNVALSVIKRNTGQASEGAVAYITSAYNTGYMVGDIRFAGLAGNGTADEEREDRSVKGNDLAETGTIPSAIVATGAELYGYGPFSAVTFLSQANDADFNFADGLFSVMCWVKVVPSGTYQAIANRYNSGDTGKGWTMYVTTSEQVYIHVYGASSVSSGFSVVLSAGWHFVCGVSDGSKVKIYADGVLANSATLAAGDLSNSAAGLHVGIEHDEANYPQTGSLSLLRISATASTPQQIKEIYEAEKPLFAANAKCLLQSPHGSLSNAVNDLAFDKSTGLLAVAQTGSSHGVQLFRGLEMAEATSYEDSTDWSSSSTSLISTAGSVVAPYRSVTTGGVLVDLPALDVRAELNDGDDKLPDDGKFHFEGVTVNATPTVIGQIPIAENEVVSVRAVCTGQIYQAQSSTWGLVGEIKQRFYRTIGGDVVARDEASKLIEETQAAMDFDLDVLTSSQTVTLKVTGDSSATLQWTAEVEVQRISDKTYER